MVKDITSFESDPQKSIEDVEDVRLSQWYWLKDKSYVRRKHDPILSPDGNNILMAVTKIGSNFIELTSPKLERYGQHIERIHKNEFNEKLTHEPDAENIITSNIRHHKRRVAKQIQHVQLISSQLGVSPETLLEQQHQPKGQNSVAVISGNTNLVNYKRDLKVAQKKTLPRLFARIKTGNAILVQWMAAETLALQAHIDKLDGVLDGIENQIFNVSLYAGLAESSRMAHPGKAADFHEKICIMQRKLFMDEECLLDYDAGGMEFKDISEFDKWLSRPRNFKRLLPFPKTVVAFQIRRNIKDRYSHDVHSAFINMGLAQQDRFTFLYVRNGEQLHRLGIDDFEFDDKLFPDRGTFDFDEPMMATNKGELLTLREYEAIKEKNAEIEKLDEKWHKENPDAHLSSPYWRKQTDIDNYAPLDKDNIYYDEICKAIGNDMMRFNRTAMIVQGLLDRSEVFHPHPPVKTWDAAGFEQMIRLVYDDSMCLEYGDPPDIEAYIRRCNRTASANSVFYGQHHLWACDAKEKKTMVYGNPGPGVLARASKLMPRSKKATFRWMRERVRWSRWKDNSDIPATYTCAIDDLFNVSAYKPGDYKKFFNDHRTRREYLKWAPMLLTAENYHAGKEEISDDRRK